MNETLLRLLAVNTCQLWRSSICSIVPNLEKIRAYMNNPRPGDWVLEISSLAYAIHPGSHDFGHHKDIKNYIGRLVIKERIESVKYPEDGEYNDKFTYIENCDGKLFKWSNCHFIRILEEMLGLDGFAETDTQEKLQWTLGAIERHREDMDMTL